jgi:hypothetical protein
MMHMAGQGGAVEAQRIFCRALKGKRTYIKAAWSVREKNIRKGQRTRTQRTQVAIEGVPVSWHARCEIRIAKNALSSDIVTNRHEQCGQWYLGSPRIGAAISRDPCDGFLNTTPVDLERISTINHPTCPIICRLEEQGTLVFRAVIRALS